jgi:hypothetical protein
MRRALRTLVSLSSGLLASLATAQPGPAGRPSDPADLAMRQRAALEMGLTVIIGLVAVILLMHLLGQRQRGPQRDSDAEQHPQ